MNFSQPELDIKNNYDKENIASSILQAKQNLKQLREFIVSCERQLEIIKNTKFNKTVIIQCLLLQGFPFYWVGCHNTPEIESLENVTYLVSNIMRFDGSEKLEAIQYAEKLAQVYRCEIKTIEVDKHV